MYTDSIIAFHKMQIFLIQVVKRIVPNVYLSAFLIVSLEQVRFYLHVIGNESTEVDRSSVRNGSSYTSLYRIHCVPIHLVIVRDYPELDSGASIHFVLVFGDLLNTQINPCRVFLRESPIDTVSYQCGHSGNSRDVGDDFLYIESLHSYKALRIFRIILSLSLSYALVNIRAPTPT